MKYTVVIIRPPNYKFSDCFLEVADAVTFGIRRMGHECELTENALRKDTQHILFGAHLLGDSALPPGSIIYNLEQVGGGNIGNTVALATNCTVWDYSKKNIADWKPLGVEAVHVPFCYVPELTRKMPFVTQDIDVLFYGSLNERRQRVIDGLKAAGLKVEVRINNTYRDDLTALMARAKVILNVHYYESKVFEIVRVGYALANRKAVVSEESADWMDYPHLQNAVHTVPYDGLIEACSDLVSHDFQRECLEIGGFTWYASVTEMNALERAGVENLCHWQTVEPVRSPEITELA
jgi:hypothetical protein